MNMLRLTGANVVELPLAGDDEPGPFVLKSAEGLGPPPTTVRMLRGNNQRATYNGRSVALRQVDMLVSLHPNFDIGETYQDVRGRLYSLMTPKFGKATKIEVVYNGVVQAVAMGHISKCEPGLFTKDPAVVIAIDCDDAFFLHPTGLRQAPAQRTVGGIRAFDIDNEGDAPSGFRMALTLRDQVGTSLYLADSEAEGERIQIDGINWLAGDKLLIDTREGSRGVWRGQQGGAWVSVLSNMNTTVSTWMQLHGGLNTLRVNVSAFDWDDNIKFLHQPAYWGV